MGALAPNCRWTENWRLERGEEVEERGKEGKRKGEGGDEGGG